MWVSPGTLLATPCGTVGEDEGADVETNLISSQEKDKKYVAATADCLVHYRVPYSFVPPHHQPALTSTPSTCPPTLPWWRELAT
jgi:hypothetical protein